MHLSQILPQHFPLFAFEYVGDPDVEPNRTGPVSLVVGWVEIHPDDDTPVLATLVPVLATLNGPALVGVLDDDLEPRLVRYFADRAEAEREHADAARHHRRDMIEAAGMDPAPDPFDPDNLQVRA